MNRTTAAATVSSDASVPAQTATAHSAIARAYDSSLRPSGPPTSPRPRSATGVSDANTAVCGSSTT